MASVKHTENFISSLSFDDAEVAIEKFLLESKIKFKKESKGKYIGQQGSVWKTTLLAKAEIYPKQFQISLDESTSSLWIRVVIQETLSNYGCYQADLKERYENYFEVFMYELKKELQWEGLSEIIEPPEIRKFVFPKWRIKMMLGIVILGAICYCGWLIYVWFPVPTNIELEGSEWSKVWRGYGLVRPNAVQTAQNGNVYICGSKTKYADFDPGWGIDLFVSAGGNQQEFLAGTHGFLAIFNPEGSIERVIDAPGVHQSMVFDSNGNIYLAGRFARITDFDPGPEIDSHVPEFEGSCTEGDNYLAKYTSSGEFSWVRTWVGSLYGWGVHSSMVLVDDEDNLIVTGVFIGSIDYPTVEGSEIHLESSQVDIYLMKFNTNGVPVWAKAFGGTRWVNVSGGGVDNDGNIIISGNFEGTGMDFDPDPEIVISPQPAGSDADFVTKFDSDGNHLWVNTSLDFHFHDLDTDRSGNFYITGSSKGPEGSNQHAILMKYNADGELVWETDIAGDVNSRGFELLLNEDGYVYISGETNMVDRFFCSSKNAFISRIDTEGQLDWTRIIDVNSCGWRMAQARNSDLYMIGYYGHNGSFLVKITDL